MGNDINMVLDKFAELKKMVMSRYTDAKNTVKEWQTKLEKITAEYKQKAQNMRKKSMTKLKDAKSTITEELQMYIDAFNKFLDETKVIDVVNYVQGKYKEGITLAKKNYALALKMKDEYT